MIVRDEKPYKKEKTRDELANHICYVGDCLENIELKRIVTVIKSYDPDQPRPYTSLLGINWGYAREVPKEDLLKLGNFQEGE